MSWGDRQFIYIMVKGVHKNESGNWEMPMPFRSQEAMMPNNWEQEMNRQHGLLRSFKRKPQMEKDYLELLWKVINPCDGKTESSTGYGKVWYLANFGVYHPNKPGQIRVVFDSSCEYKGASISKELLAGPDLMNSLLGVLMRF